MKNVVCGSVFASTLLSLQVCVLIEGFTQSQDIKYNKYYAVACHNCYESQYSPTIEDVLSHTNTIEMDIWDNERASGLLGSLLGRKMNNDWYIKHSPLDKGNSNNCGGSLKDCLIRVKRWSDDNTQHKPLTIFLDKKENWSGPYETRKPSDLDNLISSVFSSNNIYTPSLLKGNYLNLRDAVNHSNWSLIDTLKGKIVFVITDATTFTSRNKILSEYLEERDNPICFVAPRIEAIEEIDEPSGVSVSNRANIVMYNLDYSHSSFSNQIGKLEFMSRVYGGPEDSSTVKSMIDSHVNFIAMFNFRISPN